MRNLLLFLYPRIRLWYNCVAEILVDRVLTGLLLGDLSRLDRVPHEPHGTVAAHTNVLGGIDGGRDLF